MQLQLRHCPECQNTTEQVRVTAPQDDLWRCRRCESELRHYRLVKLGAELAYKRSLQAFARKPETANVL